MAMTYVATLLTRADALTNCQSMGAQLAILNTLERYNAAVAVKDTSRSCWIGGQDIDGDSIYRWDDGQLVSAGYQNWQTGHDTNTNGYMLLSYLENFYGYNTVGEFHYETHTLCSICESVTPTGAPTAAPTEAPTDAPTEAPVSVPTAAPPPAPSAPPPPLPPCANVPLNAGSSGYHRGGCWSKVPHADVFEHPGCDCGSTDLAVGSAACYRSSSGTVECWAPTRPYIPGLDDGCDADAYRCVVTASG